MEAQIVSYFEDGDSKAIELIYEHYGRALMAVILQVVPKQEIAEDILQEVLVKAWKNADKYDENKGRLYTWLLKLTRNTAIDKAQSKAYKQASQIQGDQSLVHEYESSDSIKPDNIGVSDLLKKLPPDQKEVIRLAYFQGFTQKEIADELKMPLGTVKTKVKNAITKLRTSLRI